MWFCGIPEQYGAGRNIPWYRARERTEEHAGHVSNLRRFSVRNPDDLLRLPNSPIAIKLAPDANLIRDESFLDRIIETATSRGLPVELSGSLLSHTYYRLSSAGIPVISAEPYAKYFRTRQRQTFGKLVRDNIPVGIKAGGETVSEARLSKDDIPRALVAKLCEEAVEFLESSDRASQQEELADMLEVFRALADSAHISLEDIDQAAVVKRSKRGGFHERRILLETSLPKPGEMPPEPPEVHLHEIAHPTAQENTVLASFAALFSLTHGVEATTEIDGEPVTVVFRVVNGGVRVAVRRPSASLSLTKQLVLDL